MSKHRIHYGIDEHIDHFEISRIKNDILTVHKVYTTQGKAFAQGYLLAKHEDGKITLAERRELEKQLGLD